MIISQFYILFTHNFGMFISKVTLPMEKDVYVSKIYQTMIYYKRWNTCQGGSLKKEDKFVVVVTNIILLDRTATHLFS